MPEVLLQQNKSIFWQTFLTAKQKWTSPQTKRYRKTLNLFFASSFAERCCAVLASAVPCRCVLRQIKKAARSRRRRYKPSASHSHAAGLSKCIAARIKARLCVVLCAMLSLPIVSDGPKDPTVQQCVCARRCRYSLKLCGQPNQGDRKQGLQCGCKQITLKMRQRTCPGAEAVPCICATRPALAGRGSAVPGRKSHGAVPQSQCGAFCCCQCVTTWLCRAKGRTWEERIRLLCGAASPTRAKMTPVRLCFQVHPLRWKCGARCYICTPTMLAP